MVPSFALKTFGGDLKWNFFFKDHENNVKNRPSSMSLLASTNSKTGIFKSLHIMQNYLPFDIEANKIVNTNTYITAASYGTVNINIKFSKLQIFKYHETNRFVSKLKVAIPIKFEVTFEKTDSKLEGEIIKDDIFSVMFDEHQTPLDSDYKGHLIPNAAGGKATMSSTDKFIFPNYVPQSCYTNNFLNPIWDNNIKRYISHKNKPIKVQYTVNYNNGNRPTSISYQYFDPINNRGGVGPNLTLRGSFYLNF